VHFVQCLEITDKCFNSYRFIISLCCSYMFRHPCAILREHFCTYWVTSWVWSMVDKILYSMWLYSNTQPRTIQKFINHWPNSACTWLYLNTQPRTLQNFINHRPKTTVTQQVQKSSLRMAHRCRNMLEQQSEVINYQTAIKLLWQTVFKLFGLNCLINGSVRYFFWPRGAVKFVEALRAPWTDQVWKTLH
jgi:hypothetical protein